MDFLVAFALCLQDTPFPECHEPTALHWAVAGETGGGLTGCMREGMIAASRSPLAGETTYSKVR